MGKKQEEAVVRITARYVAEVRAGRRPDIADYLVRYPQYADAIADFITYYHAIEAYEPGQTASVPLSDISRIALERALDAQQPAVTTLLTVNKQRFSLSQLAMQLDLSVDMVALLEWRVLDPSTIPLELYRRLASVLHQPLDAVLAYFALPAQEDGADQGRRLPLRVAEDRVSYPMQEGEPAQRQSFRQALEASSQLSFVQKATWYDMLSHEEI
jgi:hypothetical protein